MKIRLKKDEIEIIKRLTKDIFGDCEIFIFGSRLIDKKGGDIDLYIIPKNRENLFEKKIKLAAKLENILEKPVDVVVSYNRNRPIEVEALKSVKIS
ncbi:nucleotidyltransferase domain-containing protein [Deferribacter thermophilus]|uniref:nucleotidyltransferase family protein n=1 Tax=Deferribacter thermophilus TaxID=53573 RepID=UPI003C18FD7A